LTLPIVLVPHPHVRVNPNVLGGSPHVAGSRVPVRRLWSFYRRGTKVETLLKRFPQLEPAQVFDALAFALDNEEVVEADLARERDMLRRSGHKPPARPQGPEQIELPFISSARSVRRSRRGSGRGG
jgi:uncharacterized protein (DUF433 family)